MEHYDELEAELQRCQDFLARQSLTRQGNPNDAVVLNKPLPPQKPQTLEALLAMLEEAPAGPFELDTALIYSPAQSDGEQDSDSAADPLEYVVAAADHSDGNAAGESRPPSALSDECGAARRPADGQHAAVPSTQRRTASQRLADQRLEREQAELVECTFAPRTGRPSSGARAQSGIPVEQRLLAGAGLGREAAARRILEERREAEDAACTFAPLLVASQGRDGQQRLPPRRPLHQRLAEEDRRRAATLAKATARADAEATFQPRLNPASLRLAEEVRQARGEHAPGSTARHAAHAEPPAAPSFKPAINPLSARLLEVSATVPSDFQRRQRFYEQRQEEKRQALLAADEAQGCTFRPDTGNAAAVLALSDRRGGQLLEQPEERWERMAVAEAGWQAVRRAQAEAAAAVQHSFEPRLNPRSLKMAEGRRSVQDVAASNNRLRRAEQQRAEAEAAALRDCTFRPDTHKPRVIGYYDEYCPPQPRAPLSIATVAATEGLDGLARRIQEHSEQRERWVAEEKAEEERRRLAECTFRPDTRKSPVAMPARPVVVPGLDRVLELKALKERQQREAEARAAKVFMLQPRSPRRRGPTVPRPFVLAGEQLRERRMAKEATGAVPEQQHGARGAKDERQRRL